MDIRNFLHQKKENKLKKILAIIVLFVGIGLIFAAILFIKNNKRSYFYIGDNISVEGKILIDNNFPIHTHKISNLSGTFGLKSSSVNLNNFLDKNIIINGKINEIHGNIPILDISTIKIPDTKSIINNNKYFFVNDLISFDFSKDLDMKALKTGKNIVIYYQDQEMISIETFICNKVTPIQDCEKILKNYKENLNEMFTTFLGYTFYKNSEESRKTFNDSTLGYIFKTNDESFLLNISHLINIINSDFINQHLKEDTNNLCILEDGGKIEKISTNTKEIVDDNLIKLNLKGYNINGEILTCKLTIDIRNDREIKNTTITDS